MAGESAGEVARRQRAKAARLERSAVLWERGAQGEAATARVLDELRAHGWRTFHDVRWPGRPRANIDHVAVGPGGVFMIDAKNWSGNIRIDRGELRQNGRRRMQAVDGASAAARDLAGALGDGTMVVPVLCFITDEEIAGRVGDVLICSIGALGRMLDTRPAVLTAGQVAQIAARLPVVTSSASSPGHQKKLRTPARPQSRPSGKAPQEHKARNGVPRLVAIIALFLLLYVLMGTDLVSDLANQFGQWFVSLATQG